MIDNARRSDDTEADWSKVAPVNQTDVARAACLPGLEGDATPATEPESSPWFTDHDAFTVAPGQRGGDAPARELRSKSGVRCKYSGRVL
jgi:hypothetical protein